MTEWRLSRGRYLAIWLALVCVQLAVFFVDNDLSVEARLAWVALWQVVKVVPAVGRMNDLGRAPDDALFATLIPVANIYAFFGFLLGPTPSDDVRERRRARWKGQPSWYDAALPALRLMARTAGPGGLAALVLAVPQVILLDRIEEVVAGWSRCVRPDALGRIPPDCTLTPDGLATATQVGIAVTGFLGLYTAIQLAKRNTATPASWIPAVFFVPAAWVTGALLAVGSASYGTLVPLHVGLVTSGVIFVWHSLVGAAVAIAWVVAAHAARAGSPASLGEVWAGVRARYIDVMPAHAGRVQLVWIGSQVIVPGLFYWVYTAFVVPAGVLEDPPPHPLTRRSGQLTWGMTSRLVKLAAVYVVLLVLTQLVIVAIHGPAVAQAVLMMDTSQIPLGTQLLVEVLGTLCLWWVSVVLYLLYLGRIEQVAALRRAREAAESGAG